MNMRKIIALLLVLVMVCGVVPFAAMAEGETVNAADFNTITTSNANGDSSYKNTYTTANGWVTANSAIQCGGTKDSNPQFQVIGPDNTHKAVCMNGKVGAAGSITSPTLTGGISKLTVNFTKMFTDTKLSATVTITDLTTGATYTHTIAKEEAKDTKYVVYTDEWVLDTPITGDFTIKMVNDCPSNNSSSNKDRMTILSIVWEGAAEAPAEPKSATIDFSTADQRVSQDGNSQVWTNDGLTLTNGIGTSTQPIKDYTNPVRLYAKTTLKIEFAGMTKLEAVTPTTGYANALKDSIEAVITGATVTYVADGSNQLVTIIFAEPVDSIEFPMVAQTRFRTLTAYSGEVTTPEQPEQPEQPEVPETPADPTPDSKLTIKEAIALGASKEHNVYTTGKYYVTGVIKSVYNTQYGNMYIQDEDGNELCIYGTYSADGSTRYDAMEVQPVVGDTVTIYGIIGQYNGTPQIKNGWITEHTPAGSTPEVPEQPEQPEVPETPAFGLITAPVAGTAYKFGMIHDGVSTTDVYYINGKMASTYYFGTVTDPAAALDVYLEETTGGYYMYTMIDGVKTYINMEVSNTHVNGKYQPNASTVYTWNAELNTVVADIDGTAYGFGTRNDKTYTTVGPVRMENVYYCQFYGTIATEEPEQPENPETPEQPEPPQTGDFALIAIGTLMAMSVAAVCLLKKKEF